MNTTNFPGNTVKKRRGALERLKAQLQSGKRYKGSTEYIKEQIAILEAKLKGATS